MAAVGGALSTLTVCVCFLLLPAVIGTQSEDIECAFSDQLQQQGTDLHSGPANELRGVVRENGTVRCSRGSRCFGLWEKRADGEMHLVKQGCWAYQPECHGDRCLVTATPSKIQNGSYRFCCCGRDLCNTNFTEALPTAAEVPLKLMKTDGQDDGQTDQHPLRRVKTALIALVTVAIVAVLIVALFFGYRMLKGKQKNSLSSVDVMEAGNTSTVDLENLKLLELIGRGRYGTVFRGCLNERCVAVKLFSSANRQNYANERSIYHLPLLQQHDNIAHFLMADERTTADGRPEFLIIMEFYPHGCLSRYLSVNTVDWLTCCRMTHGVTRGLAFLHTELYMADQYKPAVAHRDITSRNVLVRSDLSCVLADFGLSMRLTGNRPCRHGDDDTMAISEVGTVRYMAPEVLGGALNLRDCESALKQVDVYALGLMYWETFRRCSDLFPGEAVPEYQLAFQAELGNHPSFEEMQILVAREKHRPRFPEAWKENSLALRSLKETMEDCWDQDAEARLTAQCAEERLMELTLLSTHTALHNHRNLSHGHWTPQVGTTSSYIEDLQGGVVKNVQGVGHPVIKTTARGPEGPEKNRNSINYERQQAQSQARSTSDSSMSTNPGRMPGGLCSISESEHSGGAVPVCLQLTEEDLEANKLDPKEVDKNLRESSDENLMEHSQKQFSSAEPQTTTLLYHHILQTAEVSAGPGEVGGVSGACVQPLPKQQNLPKRPTSLHLLSKSKDSGSSRLRLGKHKSNHRQVETGVAKMNTVAIAAAAEPCLVTTVTNNTAIRANAGTSYSAGVPTLVTNGMISGGRTNPAGPQTEEDDEDKTGTEDGRLNLLNSSPDEHEPLLRREQLPAESQRHHQPPHAANILSGRGSNSNNNNNRLAAGSEVNTQRSEVDTRRSEVNTWRSQVNTQCLGVNRITGTRDQSLEAEDQVLEPQVQSLVHSGPKLGSDHSVQSPEPPAPQEPAEASTSFTETLGLKPETVNVDVLPPDPEDATLETPGPVPTAHTGPDPAGLDPEGPDPSRPDLVGPSQILRGPAKGRRPERPCSLDLSSSCTASDDTSLTDNGTLSASGEKIKRRVKTPYTLKKWRPASWVVSMDTALDSELEFSSSQTNFTSGLQRTGGTGVPKLNQSKSSMAVFLMGGGATATTTSEPDGVTCF